MPHFTTEYEAKLYRDRTDSLEKIRRIGVEKLAISAAEAAFPNSFPVHAHAIPELRPLGLNPDGSDKSTEELEAAPIEAAIAGRLVAHRAQGKAGFAQLQGGGERLQIYVRKDDVGRTPEESEALFELYKSLHIGDHIGVRGALMRTRTGELTLKVHAITLPGHADQPALVFLAKALLALPDKYHGLEDVEQRYRQRYVDLIMNSGTRPDAGLPEPQNPGAPSSPTASSSAKVGAVPPQPGVSNVTDTAAPLLSSRSNAEGSASPEPPPGVSSVTDTAAPNEEHNDAPRNVREVFVKRAAILRAIRKFFDTRGYLEVETPMLHTVAGGAAARPFTTHHNALDIPLSLRIAPELFLKRLVVGGLDRVYEINRNFRNEGVSTRHNPEFTMLEFYQAYANYQDLMDLTEELVKFVAMEVNGTTMTHFNGQDIDLSQWQRLSMREAIVKWGAEEEMPTDGKLIAELFERVAEPHLIQPTIIYDFPLAVSPLSKVKPGEPDWTERFEFYIGGFELGNAFSELNDAEDQERRFEAQVADKDPESMAEVDHDYVRALGIGLPPTAGEGIGIDRLTMLLTGSRSIRDVILFPLMRPENSSPETDNS